VRALLDALDPRNTRAALVSFSGGDSASADNAVLEVPLTSSFKKIREGLDLMLAAGPEGATDMQAGLRIARDELRGGRPSASAGSKRAQQHVVLLTDGLPMVPYESPASSERRAVQLARRMGAEKMRVHVYAVGRQAVDKPRAAVQIARGSGGEFRAVEQPGDLPRLLPELRFARIEEVRIVPLDVSAPAFELVRSEDGDYSALVPLRKGENRVEVYARASDGREKRITTTITDAEPKLDEQQRKELARLIEVFAMKQREQAERERRLEIESERKN
jgi:hypothetical protein